MNVYEIIAIVAAVFIGLFVIINSISGYSGHAGMFKRMMVDTHERKKQKAEQAHDLKKYQMDYEVRMKELDNEKYSLEIRDSLKNIKIDYDQDKGV